MIEFHFAVPRTSVHHHVRDWAADREEEVVYALNSRNNKII